MNKRIKAITEIKSRDEFERVIDNTVTMQITKERLELRRDQKILAVRKDFDDDISDLAKKMEANVLRAEKYAEQYREELLPKNRKTAESTFAFFGFRTGNPTLVLLNRKWTWSKVIDAFKSTTASAFWCSYIIIKESVDKDGLKQLQPSHLAEVGLRVDQREVFFIDPKRDPADPQRLVAGSQPSTLNSQLSERAA
jgi:phage host-nuclease inhibitor protein Gam